MTLYIFDSTHDALAAERILLDADYSMRIIPTPRQFTESCGISLLVETDQFMAPKALLDAAEIEDVLICSVEIVNRKNVYHLIEN